MRMITLESAKYDDTYTRETIALLGLPLFYYPPLIITRILWRAAEG